MNGSTPHLDTLLELQTWHEDLLHRLDDLDRRVEKTLAEWHGSRNPAKYAKPPGIRGFRWLVSRAAVDIITLRIGES